MSSINGASAIVTGAGSGNGKAIAVRLLNGGARVALLDVDGASVEKLAAQHEGAIAVKADVTSEMSIEEAIESVTEAFDGLDILVNNAGIVRFSNFEDLSVEEWDEVFRVNSTGPFIVRRLPHHCSQRPQPSEEKTPRALSSTLPLSRRIS